MSNGGIESLTSSCSNCASSCTSYFSNAARYRASSSFCSTDSTRGTTLGFRAASVARARWSALFTAGTVISSVSAVSAADQLSTWVSNKTARCFGGRYCSAATNASRMLSRRMVYSTGSTLSSAGRASASGIGSTQYSPGCWLSDISLLTTTGSGVLSIGRTRRRSALPSTSRQTLVAIRYNQVCVDESFRNESRFFHARNIASCTASSASTTEPSIR